VLSITMYGATYCEDTARVRQYLTDRGISFDEVNIDLSPDAEKFVIFINSGARITPTLLIGESPLRIALTEPSNAQVGVVLEKGKIFLAEAA
jgi:thioredoxin reductase (NADPH)